MANQFKDRTLRKTYDALVEAYRTRHKDVIKADGSRHKGNAWANNFWWGYDNAKINWDRASKQTAAYACYRAGQDVAASEKSKR